MSGFGKSNGGTQITDLRASLKAMNAPAPMEKRPPKPRKQKQSDTDEVRWAKAEQQAMLQHTTSLLDKGKKPNKAYVRPGERSEPKKGGLFLQLMLVLILVGGVAYALDPTLIPREWTDKALETIKSWMPADT